MHTRVVTQPTYLPVTMAEARQWCRIDADITAHDWDLTLLIRAMTKFAENLTGRSFVQRELELILDCFPCRVIELPYPPLVSVSSISYLDGDGATQTLEGSPSQFQVSTSREPGHVRPLYLESWPSTRSELEAVKIRYIAGYASFSALPPELKLWMNARMATLFENREQIIIGNIVNDLPRAFVDGLLDSLITGSRIA